MNLQKYWKIAILAILAIGPGLMINSALIPSQSLIQTSFHLSNNVIFSPTIIGLIAFALFIPLGPFLRHKFGVRATYSISMILFIIGSLSAALSVDNQWIMSLGRFLQGIGTGVMLMIMIPMLVLSFPIEKRNLSLAVLLGGFFGAAIMGLLLGNIAIIYHHWRWIFYVGSALAFVGFILNRIFLRDEHHTEIKHLNWDIVGISLIVICSGTALATLNYFEQWFGYPHDLWVIIGGILLTLILFIIAQHKINHPLISFKMIMHPKPLLGLLMAVTSNIIMALSLPAVQGLLRNIYRVSNRQLLAVILCMFIGAALSALFCTLFYDKLGPGLLGFIGSIALALVLVQWLYVNNSNSLGIMACNLTLLATGLGITIGSGLMGAALGGPLPDLVSRMTAIQLIRFLANSVVVLLVGWYLNFQKVQSLSLLMTYHDCYFIALIATAVLTCLSIGLYLTGKGHQLAHKPHRDHELAH